MICKYERVGGRVREIEEKLVRGGTKGSEEGEEISGGNEERREVKPEVVARGRVEVGTENRRRGCFLG